MLEKDVLLAFGKDEAPFTYLVVPYSWRTSGVTRLGYSYRDANIQFGSILPEYFQTTANSVRITGLYHSIPTAGYIYFYVNGFLRDYQKLYLGRSDKRINFGTPYLGSETSGYASWQVRQNLFEEEDVGKEIPIWLSYTPPPY